MSSEFKLPIYYLENKERLDENIKEDLEFNKVTECKEGRPSLLEKIYKPKSKIGKLYLHKQGEYFTNNKLFLKQTQEIISKIKANQQEHQNIFTQKYDEFYDLWNKIRNDEQIILPLKEGIEIFLENLKDDNNSYYFNRSYELINLMIEYYDINNRYDKLFKEILNNLEFEDMHHSFAI